MQTTVTRQAILDDLEALVPLFDAFWPPYIKWLSNCTCNAAPRGQNTSRTIGFASLRLSGYAVWVCTLASMLAITSSKSSGLIGLEMKAETPAALAWVFASCKTSAVKAMMGV